MTNQRQIEIFRENQHLIRKIAAINIAPKLNPTNNYKRGTSNLCTRAARLAQEKILIENQRMLFKILNAGPTVNMKKQEEVYQSTLPHMERIHKAKAGSYESLLAFVGANQTNKE